MISNESEHANSRRAFLRLGAFGIVGATLAGGCIPRQKVLKYPESAEEIADFFEFFTAPSFDVQAAIKGLNITGEPKVFDASANWRRSTYPKQNDLVREIELDTDPIELTSIYIYYERPVTVSLGRLEGLCGTAKRHSNVLVGTIMPTMSAVSIFLTNYNAPAPTRNGPPRTDSFGFFPKPADKTTFAGSILIDADFTEANEKKVNMIRLERHKQTE